MTSITTGRFSPNSGIAIGPLLFIIAILAVLAGAVASGGVSFASASNKESAAVLSSALLEYQSALTDAVQILIGRGCDPAQISFENGRVDGYVNAGAPADRRCHVFDPRGGRGVYVSPPAGALDATMAASAGYGQYSFTGTYKVAGVGTDYPLMMLLPYVRQDVAEKINAVLGIGSSAATEADCDTASGPFDQASGNFFAGTFNTGICAGGAGEIGALASSTIKGKLVGCYPTSVGTPYTCYAVLLVR